MRNHVFNLGFVFSILLCLIEPAMACSCIPQPSPCEAFSQTPAVFVGRVAGIKEEKTEFTRFGVKETIRTGLIAHFVVEEALKGISQAEVDVVTGGGGGDCGYPFEEGQKYLVYAWPNKRGDRDDANRIGSTHLAGSGVKVVPGTLSASICSRTRLLKFAADDLALLRALLKGQPDNRVFGIVSERVEQFSAKGVTVPEYLGPMAGVTIKATGAATSYEVKTGAEGWFRLVNLNPGKYRLSLVIPEHHKLLYDFDKSEIEIDVPSGCFATEMGFDLQIDGRIGGTVFDAGGHPVGEDVQVSLVMADDAGKDISVLLKIHEYTDKQGHYLFDGIAPGRYILGVTIADVPAKHTPYPTTYYPKGGTSSQAQVINLSFGEKLSGYDFHLPPRFKPFIITGVVVDERGRPVPGAQVNLYDTEDLTSQVFGADVKTDRQGRFRIRGFKGRTYQVHAYKDQDYFVGTGKQAVPAEVNTSRRGRPIRLVLIKPGIFRHQLKQSRNQKK